MVCSGGQGTSSVVPVTQAPHPHSRGLHAVLLGHAHAEGVPSRKGQGASLRRDPSAQEQVGTPRLLLLGMTASRLAAHGHPEAAVADQGLPLDLVPRELHSVQPGADRLPAYQRALDTAVRAERLHQEAVVRWGQKLEWTRHKERIPRIMGRVIIARLGDTIAFDGEVHACRKCGKVKKLARFKSRPKKNKAGVWHSIDLAVCDYCRRVRSLELKAARRASRSTDSERSGEAGARDAPPSLEGGTVCKPDETLGGLEESGGRRTIGWEGPLFFAALFDLPWENGRGWLEVQSGLRWSGRKW
jgi:hypothetical protein